MKKPEPSEDWLYDMFCYSEEFSTDRATVIMRELGVTNPALKDEFKLYNIFFKNKERIAAFKNLNITDFTEEKVHMAVLAVLSKTKIMDFEEILKSLIKDYVDEDKRLYENIKKFGSEAELWNLIRKYYGYPFEEKSLERFMAMLLMTNMNETIKFQLPKQYDSFISKKITNCIVFLDHFMNNVNDSVYYDKMQHLIGDKLKINALLDKNDSEAFISNDTFEEVDKLLLRRITNLLKDGVEEYDKYLNLLSSRRTLHYYRKYISEYKTLKWSINLLKKKKELESLIKTENIYAMIIAVKRMFYVI